MYKASYTELLAANEALQLENERLQAQLYESNRKQSEYLSNWVAAQDLAAWRNLQIMTR